MPAHPTAVVHPEARVGADVTIGPFAVVGREVEIGDGVTVGPHCVIDGRTALGPGCALSAHVCLGGPPQDPGRAGEPGALVIGARNVFREFVTVHAGSAGGATVIGDDGYFMANSHVAHDARVGSGVVFAGTASVSARAAVGDGVVLGALASVHQDVRVGRLAMVGAGAMCSQDVPPFTIAQGDRARLFGLNVIALRKAGFEPENVRALKDAWRVVFTSGVGMRAGMHEARTAFGDVPEVAELLAFLEGAPRGVSRAASVRGAG
jgi:UDP-N-acetylglucosamine acyltransferase